MTVVLGCLIFGSLLFQERVTTALDLFHQALPEWVEWGCQKDSVVIRSKGGFQALWPTFEDGRPMFMLWAIWPSTPPELYVNLDSYLAGNEELAAALAHEFGHVWFGSRHVEGRGTCGMQQFVRLYLRGFMGRCEAQVVLR